MTQQEKLMFNTILASRSPQRYIRPHFELAEHIVSHRISLASFLSLKAHYVPTHVRVVTTYYYTDITLKDTYDTRTAARSQVCNIRYRHETQAEGNIEFNGESVYDLSVSKFPPILTYHHERQSICYIYEGGAFTMILEALIPGITAYPQINASLTEEQLASAISLSYCLVLKPNIKGPELMTQLDVLKKYTLPADVDADADAEHVGVDAEHEDAEQLEQSDANVHPSAYEN